MNETALYIVATPIGNLEDLTVRASRILREVDWIAAEDTRHSRKLLHHYQIQTTLVSLHQHNEKLMAPRLINRLLQGQSGALISDAGTPVLSDPGYPLVQAAWEAGVRVVPIPGPSSIIAALSAAAIPVQRFVFEGFLPSKAQGRRQHLQSLAHESRSMVMFEAPHRIQDTLKDCCEVFGGDRMAVVARELTKVHETLHRGSLANLVEIFSDSGLQRGELVLVIAGNPQAVSMEKQQIIEIAKILSESVSVKEAAALTAKITGARKNDVYALLIDQKSS